MANRAGGHKHPPTVCIETTAEDGAGLEYTWKFQFPVYGCIRQLAAAWAGAHGVPETSVGFEDMQGKRLEPRVSAAELGWKLGEVVKLEAIPLDPLFEFSKKGGAGRRARALAAAAAAAAAMPKKSFRAKALAKKALMSKKAKQGAAAAASKAKGSGKVARGGKLFNAAKAKAKASAKEGGGDKRADGGAKSPKKGEKRNAKGKAAKEVRHESNPGARYVLSSQLPDGDDPIEFDQVNRKRPGTSSWERYEKYKAARTVNEALELGAAKGDIKYDMRSGLCKSCS